MLGTLMQRLKQGDSSALADIYQSTKKAVFSVCFTMTRDYSLAQDIMQDTFLRVQKYIDHYKEQDQAKAWILRIAKNLCLNEIKKRKREVPTEDNKMPLDIDYTNEIKAKDESGIIQLTLKSLNHNEAKIVLMHTIGDISLKDIATLLKKPAGTVRWQYNNALKKLRTKIEKGGLL